MDSARHAERLPPTASRFETLLGSFGEARDAAEAALPDCDADAVDSLFKYVAAKRLNGA